MNDEGYCLETSIIVDWLRGDEDIDEKIEKIQESSNLFVAMISLCELYKGAYISKNKEHSLQIINDLADDFDILNLTKEACKEFGKEYAMLEKIGKRTQDSDLMIACIAKINGLIVVTRNKKHFENVDVKVEVW
jgi:tRNA(fMet)-specific endonuclease VapC